METHLLLKSLVDRLGPGVLADADGFRAALDDYMPETSFGTGEINLLVDAVRLGGFEQLDRMLQAGADPSEAIAAAGDRLAHERGSTDPTGARWACAALAFAVGAVPETEVDRYAVRRGGGGTLPQSEPVPPVPPTASRADAPTAPRPAEQAPPTSPAQVGPGAPPAGPPIQVGRGAGPVGPPGPVPSSAGSGSRGPYVILGAALLVLVAIAGALAVTQPWAGSDSPTDTASDARVGSTPTTSPGGSQTTTTEPSESTPETSAPESQPAPPAPFESAAMWDMARPYFSASDCSVPDSQDDAPVVWPLQPELLIKCLRSDYSATYVCTNTWPELLEAREALLGRAVGEVEPLSGQPAEQEPFPFQVGYYHETGDATRVYWDTRIQLCGGELQVPSDDLAATIELWRTGRPS